MNAFQTLNDVNQDLKGSFSGLLNGGQQSTLWIANTEETPIAAITIQEKDMTLILKIHIHDIHLVKLNVQITPETVLIQGQPTEAAGVEGYFCPSGFASLIPLPYRIYPETYWTEIHRNGLTIQLAKQLEAPQSKVLIELETANFSERSKICT